MRVALLDEPQRVRDVAGLTDHVQPLLALQQQAQAGPDDLVVVREDDVDVRAASGSGMRATIVP